ncbi:MAG TPA: efflux RND transporter periplasmic adaptor subunit [Rhizomicrobium sp.]|nr:efflux RND transporter periplasmic adaptor subunit [Rhizomicrobium sp.]
MKMFRARLFATITLAGFVTAAMAQASGDPAPVSVSTARMVRMAPQVALPGTVVSRNDSKLASEVEGRVAWVADVGDVVKKGDVIARLDKSMVSMQLASDSANVNRLGASLRYDSAQAARMKNLMDQNAIAKSTSDQAASQRDVTAAELSQARAQLSRTRYQYDHSEIRAPFSGRVVSRLIQAGEYATAGKEIVRLVDTENIEVKTQTPIDNADYLREGMPVTVDVGHKHVLAKVRTVVPVGDEASRTIEVRLTLKPGDALVGDAAKVFIPSAVARNVLAVPRDALVLREDNTYIFKVGPKSVAQRIAIETGSEDGSLVEVRGPIQPGDKVIVRGAERLETGQKVKAKLAS